ncbi:MAG: phosphoglycerate kinase [Gemmatimonadota bacterium]
MRGRRALVRVDFNVPQEGEGDRRSIVSDARIRATVPTIRALGDGGAIVVLASHLGRPKGRRVDALSLRPVAEHLEGLLGREVTFLEDPFGDQTEDQVAGAAAGAVFLLENLRFHREEEANDPAFARRLAGYGDFFVQDAFGTCHRAHASTVGVTAHLEPCVAGLLVERELAAFRRLLDDPERPLVAILGGAKISGKLETVRGLAARCDRVCLGGGMANTFLKAGGAEIGASLVEDDLVGEAAALLEAHGERILLPTDAVVARALAPGATTRTVASGGVPPEWKILDIGPDAVAAIGAVLGEAQTVFWNGPVGVFETPPFDAGTRRVAEYLAAATARGAYTVAGGGDCVAAIEQADLVDTVSHVSTGGGAALELLSGAALPGIVALDPQPAGRA